MIHFASLRRNRGFTLVETIVVMGILATLTVVALPWFFKISQRNIVKSAAREVSITLAAARMRAVKRNLPAQVLLTRAGGTQGFHKLETFELTTPSPTKVGELDLPTTLDFPISGVTPPNPTSITFGGDGRATVGTFTIRGVMGAGLTNDLPVEVSAAGRIAVLLPNPPTGAWK